VHDITEGKVTIGFDGEQALKSVSKDEEPSPSDPDEDLISDIRRKVEKSPLTIAWKWIRGHQDDKVPEAGLDEWALLNIRMDTNAKRHWRATSTYTPPNHRFSDEKITFYFEGRKLSRMSPKLLYNLVYEPRIQAWSKKRHELSESNWRQIHWKASGQALRGVPMGTQRWFTKHATRHCAVGRMELRRKHQDHSDCPRCGETNETTIHLLRCRDERALEQWDLSMEQLKKGMNATETSPKIFTAVVNRLTAWHNNVQPAPIDFVGHPNLLAAILEQDDIGWHPFLLGMISQKFAAVQATYYLRTGKKKTGLRWLVALIKKLWDISWDMWQQRNDINHNTMTPRKIQELAGLHLEVNAQFERGTAGLPLSEHHWLQDQELILSLPMDRLKLWMQSITLARDVIVQTDRARRAALLREQQLFRNWLIQP
jgi:hypothetical protein